MDEESRDVDLFEKAASASAALMSKMMTLALVST